MMNTLLRTILCAFLLVFTSGLMAQQVTLSGSITDSSTGETLIGATVFVDGQQTGVSTNVYGFYSLSLKPGTYTINYSYIGYKTLQKQLELSEDLKLNIELESMSLEIGEAVVEGKQEAEERLSSAEMSTVNMKMETIKKIPAFMGEVDVIKAIQLLPGVATVGEGNSGFYVRGGSVDQNLILLDEAAVYNASHLLGFFSVFNPDAIKDVQLYKGGIPARYGGRLSSVLDIRMREGNQKKFSAEGGIGTVSSRLTIEAPLAKDKGSFLISGRRTYVDLFLKLHPDEAVQNTRLYFYDTNLKANYKLGENDRIFLSGYFGRDVNGFGDLFRIAWGNATATMRWNHIYNSKLFSNLTLIYSDYDYELGQEDETVGFTWESNIRDLSAKLDYTYYLTPSNTVRFGAIATHHKLNPGFARGTGSNSIINEIRMPVNNAMEYGVYLSNEQSITDELTAHYGIRYSMFQNVGNGTYWNYDDQYNPMDSVVNTNGVYNTYGGFEPRLGLSYRLNERSSVKASYNRTMQYLHLASNSTSSSPLDIWFASSPNIEPQIADQVALGYFRNFKEGAIQASAEVYYKTIDNAIDFKNHAQLLLNKHLEGELRIGQGRSYGLELLFEKTQGKLTGLLSYTLARSERNIPEIYGDWYPTKFDKTHDIALTGTYSFNDRMSLSANFIYSTGAAVTLPTGRFEYMGEIVPVYSDRNGERMPSYHRLDLSFTVQSKKNKSRRLQIEKVFSIYNAYFRKNAYSINFREDPDNPGTTIAEKTYLLPIVPAITINFKF